MLRLFIAVTLPEDALRACAEETRRVEAALGPLARGVRFPRGEGLHFTLKFLGATPDDQLAPIASALELAARERPPFALALEGLQAFPSARKPRVVFLGATEGSEPMARLAEAVERHVAPLGFPSEGRGFTAHVTLARVKDFKAAPRIGERLQALEAKRVARIEVADVALMRSELDSSGSRYSALARARLAQSPTST
jgi:2'-5' RNA ligase